MRTIYTGAALFASDLRRTCTWCRCVSRGCTDNDSFFGANIGPVSTPNVYESFGPAHAGTHCKPDRSSNDRAPNTRYRPNHGSLF
jgi:hypothetical protein